VQLAIGRYYFYSGTGAVAPLLNLTTSGSDAIYKVAVAHLCWKSPSQYMGFCIVGNKIIMII